MPFVKGYIQTKEFQEKQNKARRVKYGKADCLRCGKAYEKYKKDQKYCSPKCCKEAQYYNEDPIKYKARKISGSLRMGKGKTKKIIGILEKAIGKKCRYCDTIISLDNASLDHKYPRKNKYVYNRKTKQRKYTYEEMLELDKIENLQIICEKCNRLKSDFTDIEYEILITFLNDNLELKDKLLKRLGRSHLFKY